MQNLNELLKKNLMSRYSRSNGVSIRNQTKKSCGACSGGKYKVITPVIKTMSNKSTCTSCTKIFDMHGN